MFPYFLPARPPRASSPYASVIASTTVDLPDPFSPTRNVIGAVNDRPSVTNWATAGTSHGHPAVGVPGGQVARSTITGASSHPLSGVTASTACRVCTVA